MKYTLEQCIEQQKKVDAGIKHNGEYMPWLAGVKEVIEMCDHLSMIDTWKKQPAPDNKQAFMEAVDVFAFIMSAAIRYDYADQLIRSYNNSITKAFEHIDAREVTFEGMSKENLLCEMVSNIAIWDFDNALFALIRFCNVAFQKGLPDICYYYMGKQALTQFRQANGYKTGDYIKNWLGKEDNEHLTEMLEKGVSVEYIPTALEDAYSLVVQNV